MTATSEKVEELIARLDGLARDTWNVHDMAQVMAAMKAIRDSAALLSSLNAQVEEMRKDAEIARLGLEAMFTTPTIKHEPGCLFRNDARMPCQCGYSAKIRTSVANAEALCRDALERLNARAALSAREAK